MTVGKPKVSKKEREFRRERNKYMCFIALAFVIHITVAWLIKQ